MQEKAAVCPECGNWTPVYWEGKTVKLILHRKNIGDIKYCDGSGRVVKK